MATLLKGSKMKRNEMYSSVGRGHIREKNRKLILDIVSRLCDVIARLRSPLLNNPLFSVSDNFENEF